MFKVQSSKFNVQSFKVRLEFIEGFKVRTDEVYKLAAGWCLMFSLECPFCEMQSGQWSKIRLYVK
jgi:hypothetical protein